MFRESAKTSYVLKSFPLYRLTYPIPEARYIVIIKNNQELASAKLAEIANEYINDDVRNKNLLEVHKNSAKMLEVTCRGVDEKNYRVRIEAFGKGSSIRGLSWGTLRPQIIIGDDLQDLEDSMSEATLDKDWDWFLSDVNFLAKTGRIFLIGNNLGEKCIIERIFKNDILEFEKLRVPAIDEENNVAFWPEKFSMEFLIKEKKQYTELGKLDIWYRERMCVAIPEEMRIFKKEYFKYIDEQELRQKNLDYYITIDPAISEDERADDTVLAVVGKERDKPDWYIVDFVGGHLDPIKTIDALFMLYDKYRPIRVGVETVAYQKALAHFIREEQRKREVYFSIFEINTKRNKEIKIKSLQPMFKAGVIHHRNDMFKFEEQLLSFPKGLHDDYIDAVAMVSEIVISTSYKHEPKRNPGVKTFGGQVVGIKKPLYSFNNY